MARVHDKFLAKISETVNSEYDPKISRINLTRQHIFVHFLFLSKSGMGKGRDSPAKICPSPDCPVALSAGPDHGDLRDGTGIPTLSRDNRPSLARIHVKFLTKISLTTDFEFDPKIEGFFKLTG